MISRFLHRFLGIGKLPSRFLDLGDSERVQLLLEGIPGSVRYQNYTAPGHRHRAKRVWMIASLLITDRRLVICAFSKPVVHMPRGDDLAKQLGITVQEGKALHLSLDASVLSPQHAGQIGLVLKTGHAKSIATLLGQSGQSR
jgi:hypothetical protein